VSTITPKRHPAGTLQEMREYNARHGFPHQEWELVRIDRKWRSLGREASQPTSMRGVENHN
jgi:hypothetical protein